MVTTSSSQIEYYNNGITRTTTVDGVITIIRTEGDMSRDGINTWASLLVLTMQEWKSERPLAILHDLTHPNQGFTPYVRQRTLDVLRQRPQKMITYNALVLPDTFIKRIIDMFIRTPIFKQDGLHVRIFGDEDDALNWLRTQVADD